MKRTLPSTEHTLEPFMTIKEVVALLRVTDRTVRSMLAAGRLPPPDLRVGHLIRWRESTIRAWIESNQGKPV